jgi:hypothetical protein
MGGTKKLFTDKQEQFYREHCRDLTYQQQVDLMNQTFGLGITKAQCKAWRTNHKFFGMQDGRYQKGHVPMNKGMRWDDYMSSESQKKSRETCFKKRNIPKNRKPIGNILMREDGYLWIKIRDGRKNGNWVQLHRYVWEKAYGPIPKKHKLVFLDRNTRNCSLENLMLVSESDLLIANKKYGMIDDPEINQAVLKTAKLDSALIAAKQRRRENGEPH